MGKKGDIHTKCPEVLLQLHVIIMLWRRYIWYSININRHTADVKINKCTFIESVDITCWQCTPTEKVWPHSIFPYERCLSQAFGCLPVTFAENLLTFVLEIIWNEKRVKRVSSFLKWQLMWKEWSVEDVKETLWGLEMLENVWCSNKHCKHPELCCLSYVLLRLAIMVRA